MAKKMKTEEYKFKVYKESNGYWAECINLKGCNTQGDTLVELKANIKEALTLYLETQADLIVERKA